MNFILLLDPEYLFRKEGSKLEDPLEYFFSMLCAFLVENRVKDITDWFGNFIKEFRRQSEKLSEKERSRISNLDDFFSPCQVLLLWFKDANFQYLICTHDDNRKDLEIEVEGPIPSYGAIGRLDTILRDPKWNRKLTEKEKKQVFPEMTVISEMLEGLFLNIIQELRNRPLRKPPTTSFVGRKYILISRDFVWHISGNIAEIDKAKMVTKILDQAKKEAKIKPAAPPHPKPLINSSVTYFYPPIWVGKVSKKTFKEKARGAYILPTKALDLEYKGRIMIINQDGLIVIGEENVHKATRMLNEIMATSLLLGLEANAVRELEVGNAKIDSSSLTIASWGTRAYTLRTQLAYIFLPQQLRLEDRTNVRSEDINKIIQQAERISQDPDISDFLTFFLQAHTHLKNSEYSQSFIMSWVIIERQMLWLWKKFLKEEQMPKKRRDKLTNLAYRTIDFVIEGLNIGGRLSKKEYEDLIVLKNKRNDIIHQGESTTLEEAEKCFQMAKSIVKQRSGLTQSNL